MESSHGFDDLKTNRTEDEHVFKEENRSKSIKSLKIRPLMWPLSKHLDEVSSKRRYFLLH